MQTYLVTGAAGFIGSHLSEALLRRGDRVVGFDNLNAYYDPRIKRRNLAQLAIHAGFSFVEGDLREKQAVDAVFEAQAFDAVIHLAAMAGVRPSIVDPVLYTEVNLTGTTLLLEGMRHSGCRRLQFGSSSSVYGGCTEIPFRESFVADRPVSPYAATKRAGEVLCHAYHHLFGFAIACLRFFTVYGPRQRPEMAIHQFTRLIDEGRPIPFFGDGSSRRDYTFVGDIVDGVVRSLDKTTGFEVYNLGGSHTVSLKELVELIEARVGKPAILDRRPDQPGDVPITSADVSKAEREIGYRPQTGIEQGLDRFMDWYRENQRVTEAS